MSPLAAGALLAGTFGLVALLRTVMVRAAPDHRDGNLVRAGVGIAVLDRIVQFPASVQRVRFEAEALTSELLPIHLDAFALWSVSSEDPLATRRMGLGHTAAQSSQHLLSRPQYHAFQQAFAGLVRRHAGRFTLEAVCRDPAPLSAAVLASAQEELGHSVPRSRGSRS